MPFSHSFGLARLRACMVAGQKITVTDGLKSFPRIYGKKDLLINGLSFVPAAIEILKFLLKDKASFFGQKIKYMEIGSSSITLDARLWLKDNFPLTNILHHYGMTEASRSFFVQRGSKDDLNQEEGYLGFAAKGVEYKLLKSKKGLGINNGEIFIKGPNADMYFFLTVR